MGCGAIGISCLPERAIFLRQTLPVLTIGGRKLGGMFKSFHSVSVFTLLLISQAELGLQNSLVRRNLRSVLQKRNRLVSSILLNASGTNHDKQRHIVRRNFGSMLERRKRFVIVAHGLLDARELKPTFHKSRRGDGRASHNRVLRCRGRVLHSTG